MQIPSNNIFSCIFLSQDNSISTDCDRIPDGATNVNNSKSNQSFPLLWFCRKYDKSNFYWNFFPQLCCTLPKLKNDDIMKKIAVRLQGEDNRRHNEYYLECVSDVSKLYWITLNSSEKDENSYFVFRNSMKILQTNWKWSRISSLI